VENDVELMFHRDGGHCGPAWRKMLVPQRPGPFMLSRVSVACALGLGLGACHDDLPDGTCVVPNLAHRATYSEIQGDCGALDPEPTFPELEPDRGVCRRSDQFDSACALESYVYCVAVDPTTNAVLEQRTVWLSLPLADAQTEFVGTLELRRITGDREACHSFYDVQFSQP